MRKKLSKLDIRIRRSQVNKYGLNEVYLRFMRDGSYTYFKTGIQIELSHWNFKSNRLKPITPSNIQQNIEIDEILNEGRQIILNQPRINSKDFGEKLYAPKNHFTKRFLDIFDEYIFVISQDPNKAIGTVTNYQKVFNKCEKLWSYSISIEELDNEYLQQYINYYSRKGNSINYLNRNIKCIKTVLNYAVSKDISVKNSALKFKLQNKETQRTALTSNEVGILESYFNSTTNESHKKVLKLYLFGCYTGLRYSDIVQLKPSDIVENFIHKKVQKSNMNRFTKIPLIFKANQMIQEYPFFDTVSNQKCNKYLKEISYILGIEKRITFHTSRHTFATLALNYGIPIEVVSEILSHTRISTTQIYAKMRKETLLNEMNKFKL